MEWIRGAKIGQGSFGTVNLAKPRSENLENNLQLWAVKSCSVSNSVSLMNEKRILDELKDCPEIIQCYGDCYTIENNENLYNLCLEYVSEGALYRKIKNSTLPEIEIRRYSKGIIRGLNYIHTNGFVHCDIKLQNILLNQDGDIKIADFGLAKRVGENKEGNLSCELRGTPMYMSPEIVTGGDQTSASDIWAVGCLIVEMFTGSPVWNCSELPELLMRIGGGGSESPEIPEKLSDEGKDFLKKCFIKNPEERWTAEMLLSHPFLTYDVDQNNCQVSSTSPTTAFDFPDFVSEQSSPEMFGNTCSWFSGEVNLSYGSLSESPVDRLRRLVCHQQQFDVLNSEEWITVR